MSIDYRKGYLILFPEEKHKHMWLSPEVMSQLLARALNTWSDAPPEAKELHDLVVHGVLFQDYREQSKSTQEQE